MSLQRRLRADLVTAIRERRKTEVSMIRTLIAALENAEAVEAELSAEPKVGLNHDRERRALTDEDIARVLETEHTETMEAATRYRELGAEDEAADLELRGRIIRRYLESPT